VTNRSTASPRVIMRLEVPPDARDGFTNYCERMGMTQVATMSRLVEWLSRQPDVVRAGILGLYPGDIRDKLPAVVLAHIAKGERTS
jgi:hypothetical protein